jgi:type I restriction enzyme, S subunit
MYLKNWAMKSNYKQLGNYIELFDIRNHDCSLGLEVIKGISSISKSFVKTKANLIGVSPENYKVVEPNQFSFNPNTARMGDKIPIALNSEKNNLLVSSIYPTFKIIYLDLLLPEYLMMWFIRAEFDRYARFYSHGSAREVFDYSEMCKVQLPVPSIEKQREIVKEYNTIVNRIKLHEQLNQKLEETAQTLYKHWFVDFEFPNEDGQPYKSSGGKLVYNKELDQEIPEGWLKGQLSDISEIIMGQSPSGESYNKAGIGEIFYQGRTEFGFRLPEVKSFTTEPKRRAKKGDILMSVRAPVGDLNIANSNCCIGRGVASLCSKEGSNSFLFYLMKDVKRQFDIANEDGTVFGSITKNGLHEVEIVSPKPEVMTLFNKYASRLDNKIENQCRQILCLEETRRLLLSRMTKTESLETEQVL